MAGEKLTNLSAAFTLNMLLSHSIAVSRIVVDRSLFDIVIVVLMKILLKNYNFILVVTQQNVSIVLQIVSYFSFF